MIQFQLTTKIFKLLNKNEKYVFFFLIATQFISAGLELLSIGSMLPIFKAVTDPSWNEKYFGFFDEKYRIIYIFLIVVFIFLIKNIFVVQLAYYSGKFRNQVSLRVINTIYNSYLNKEYQFHINNHSSILLRNMQYADGIDSTIMRLVNFYSDLILAAMAIVVVSLIDIKITIAASLFLSLLLISYAFTTKLTIEKYGKNSINYNTSYLKNMMEGIKSYREILLSGSQNFFTRRNSAYKEQALRYKLRFQIIELIPKYIIEFFFIVTIISCSAYFIIFDNIDLNKYLPLIGVMMLGLLKILPNILRIFSSYQQLKFLIPQIEIVNNSLLEAQIKNELNIKNYLNKKIKFENEINLQNITFKYENKIILEKINLKIDKNECIGIKGESGSGKSTILNIISGLLQPSDGLIFIDKEKKDLSNRKWQNKIGYVSQNTRLIDDTIRANILFGSQIKDVDIKKIEDLIERTGLKSYINELPNGLDTIVGENGVRISGGQAQRLGIARALYNSPEIMILDEPTNSLDKDNENKIIDALKKLKGLATIIIVSHNIHPLEIADTKYVLSGGILKKI